MPVLLLCILLACNPGVTKPKAQRQEVKEKHTSLYGAVDESPAISSKKDLEDGFYCPPLPKTERRHPKVGKLTGKGSLSIKSATDGFLVNCKELPIEGQYHKILQTQARRQTNCATDELVQILLEGAQTVGKKFEGAKLPVGNLSRWGGGDVPYSVSHNSGRDVDVGFYLVDDSGKQVIPDDLVKIGHDGTGIVNGSVVRLDLAKQWAFVRYLLEQRHASLQWIFVATHIRQKLLDYAKAHKEKEEVIRKAELVMAQPARSEPHDDHMHIRIYCSEDDILEGCKDTGSNRPWFVQRDDLVRRRVQELSSIIKRPKDNNELADAMVVLARLGRREFAEVFIQNLRHPQASVRLSAGEALLDLGASGLTKRLLSLLPVLKEDVVPLVLRAIDGIPNKKERAFALASLLGIKRRFSVDMGVFKEERSVEDFALDALMFSEDPQPSVEALVDAISRADVDKQRVSDALSFLTGFKPQAKDLAKEWKQFYKTRKGSTPYQWFASELRRQGIIKGEKPTIMDIPALLDALSNADYRYKACSTVLVTLLKTRKEMRFSLAPFKVFAHFYDLMSRQN